MMSNLTPEEMVDGTEIDWSKDTEEWNEYKLDDGTTLKIKIVLRGVKRLNKHSPDGLPIYVVNTTNIVRAVGVPTNLIKKEKVASTQVV